jgi:hypothetical protein
MLKVIIAGLDPTDGKDACIEAMSLSSTFAQLRLGEPLPDSEKLSKFNPADHPTVADLSLPSGNEEGKHGLWLHLPRTKVAGAQGEDAWIPRQGGALDPIHSIKKHIHVNKLSKSHPLASYIDKSGKRKALSRYAFLKRVNEILTKAGYKKVSGHCFRIGGTTFYLLAGVNPEVVKAFGRWKSSAFLRYWRSLDSLAILHIHHLPTSLSARKNPSITSHTTRYKGRHHPRA